MTAPVSTTSDSIVSPLSTHNTSASPEPEIDPVPVQFPENVLTLSSNTPVTWPQHTSPIGIDGLIDALTDGLIDALGETEALTLGLILGETDGL